MPTETQFHKEADGSLSETTRKAIISQLYTYVEEYSIEQSPSEHRNHLGVSVIGDACSRKLWYGFRWCKLEHFQGRMRRLFKRGHNEEKNFISMLFWMGFHIREIDPDTNKQYKFSKVNGHYGGSGDSIGMLPWFRDDQDRILIEYKTHNKKSFAELQIKGLKVSKPKHFAQMCGYGREFKTRYGLYCAINKDDDDFWFDLIELDWNYAAQLENKATDIIYARFSPQKISENPSYFDCKYCSYRGICHYNEPVEINCRSCKMATAVEAGQWHCSRFNQVIPAEFISKGCEHHVSVNA